ncbi:MAG: nucleotide pyrophosphohydrolase [Desemzia incerta]
MNNGKSSIEKINEFRDDRDWRQFHNEKDLAISISLEASELLELFQWKTAKEVNESNLERIKEELADVLIYSYMLADNLNLNIDSIIDEKLQKNNEKYPVSKSKGNNNKYTEFE